MVQVAEDDQLALYCDAIVRKWSCLTNALSIERNTRGGEFEPHFFCRKWASTTIRRARIGSRMACQADERTGNLSELPRSKAEIQGWFAGIALARSRIDAAA